MDLRNGGGLSGARAIAEWRHRAGDNRGGSTGPGNPACPFNGCGARAANHHAIARRREYVANPGSGARRKSGTGAAFDARYPEEGSSCPGYLIAG
ncbi:MAG: hypothetical protein M0Q01_16195 [Syntrophales bacterium]|nr:hypothetical protein [Syntrophales bacterium]